MRGRGISERPVGPDGEHIFGNADERFRRRQTPGVHGLVVSSSSAEPAARSAASALSMSRGLAAYADALLPLVATAGDAMAIWTTVVKDGSGSGGLRAISSEMRERDGDQRQAFLFRRRPDSSGWTWR
ncbi:MAG: hypothetical protein ACLSHC_04675 [Bilophila wadsworthia]